MKNVFSLFTFVDDVKRSMLEVYKAILSIENAPKIDITFNNKYFSGTYTILDLTWYAPYKELGDNVICTFMYFVFVFKVFKNLPAIISGTVTGVNSFNEIKEDINEHSARIR